MEYVQLEVWREFRSLVNSVYEATKQLLKAEVYGLINQLRRYAVSVPSNIAERFGGRNSKDTIQFLHISRGSNSEPETLLDQKFLMQTEFDSLKSHIKRSKKLINEFINYYKSSNK